MVAAATAGPELTGTCWVVHPWGVDQHEFTTVPGPHNALNAVLLRTMLLSRQADPKAKAHLDSIESIVRGAAATVDQMTIAQEQALMAIEAAAAS